MKPRILLIALFAMLVGCNITPNIEIPQPPDGEVFLRSFVPVYYSPSEIIIKASQINKSTFTGFTGICIGAKIGEQYAFYSKGNAKEQYDLMCEKHGDMGYNRTVTDYRPLSKWSDMDFYGYLDISFVSLTLKSDANYDAEHPAGTDLGDIFCFSNYSAYGFIENDYTLFDWNTFSNDYFRWGSGIYNYLRGERPIYPVGKPISDLAANDLRIIGSGYGVDNIEMLIQIEALQRPTLAKTHNITVTLTADDGRVFSDTVQVMWE